MNVRALSWSTTLTIWLVTAMTIASEISEPFKKFLTSVAGHHWVTKSIFAFVFFLVMLFLLNNWKDNSKVESDIKIVIWSAILGGLVILCFFVWHFLQ